MRGEIDHWLTGLTSFQFKKYHPVVKKLVAKALQAMGLEDRARHRPDQLSGGQHQRVAIARAIIMEPGIILADEPTGNLDHTSGKAVLESLEELNNKGITIIVVTHDPVVAKRASIQFRMMDGRLLREAAGRTTAD